jgi:hypothetical protein
LNAVKKGRDDASTSGTAAATAAAATATAATAAAADAAAAAAADVSDTVIVDVGSDGGVVVVVSGIIGGGIRNHPIGDSFATVHSDVAGGGNIVVIVVASIVGGG